MIAYFHLVCPDCGQANRLPQDRPAAAARCGRCSARIFTQTALAVDEPTFLRHLAVDERPLLVDVWAPWCGPCRVMSPAFGAAAAILEPEVRLLTLNADAAPMTSQRFAIRSIPTVLLLTGGRLVARTSGAMTTDQIVAWTRQHMPAQSPMVHA